MHSYLSKVNVSIPNIYENDDVNNILILEDFGNLRFDRILRDYPLKKILPESGFEAPYIHFASVDLPAPFSPNRQ